MRTCFFGPVPATLSVQPPRTVAAKLPRDQSTVSISCGEYSESSHHRPSVPAGANKCAASENCGWLARPHPRERSPPNPESANSRNADFTRASHVASETSKTPHQPAFEENSRQAVRWDSVAPVTRSTAAADRRETRKG